MRNAPAADPALSVPPSGRGRRAAGFTLLEILVAMTVLGIGFVALFGVLSNSLRNVSRIEERGKLVRSAQMKLNEICLNLRLGRELSRRSGDFAGKYRWRAEVRTVDGVERTETLPDYRLARVRLQVTWQGSRAENQYLLETMTWVPTPPQR